MGEGGGRGGGGKGGGLVTGSHKRVDYMYRYLA